jgi:hypothetical protein
MDTCDIVIIKCDERFIELSKNSKPFYSVNMFFHAQQKTLFKKCGIQRFDKICEIEIIRNELVVAARLRGEI